MKTINFTKDNHKNNEKKLMKYITRKGAGGSEGPLRLRLGLGLGGVLGGVTAGAVGEGEGPIKAHEGRDPALAPRRELQRQHAEGARELRWKMGRGGEAAGQIW